MVRLRGATTPLCRLLIALVGLSQVAGAWAEADREVSILLSQGTGIYAATADAIIETLRGELPADWHPVVEVAGVARAAGRPSLRVAIGTAATRAVMQTQHDAPLLAILIPSVSFRTLQAALPPATTRTPVSAVFVDQPLSRQLALIRALLPRAKVVGALLGPAARDQQLEFEQAAEHVGLQTRTTLIAAGENPVTTLAPLLRGSDVVLGLADPAIYNSVTIKPILISTYRGQVPLIGLGPAYVRAGVLATVYSTPAQIGQQAGELILRFANGGDLPPPQYPARYSVAVNEHVAKALNIHLPDPAALEAAVGRLGQGQ